jgi:hypothetical protein
MPRCSCVQTWVTFCTMQRRQVCTTRVGLDRLLTKFLRLSMSCTHICGSCIINMHVPSLIHSVHISLRSCSVAPYQRIECFEHILIGRSPTEVPCTSPMLPSPAVPSHLDTCTLHWRMCICPMRPGPSCSSTPIAVLIHADLHNHHHEPA